MNIETNTFHVYGIQGTERERERKKKNALEKCVLRIANQMSSSCEKIGKYIFS